MVARATAPNAVGPGSVFPDAAKWDFEQGLKGFLFSILGSFRRISHEILQGARWLCHCSGLLSSVSLSLFWVTSGSIVRNNWVSLYISVFYDDLLTNVFSATLMQRRPLIKLIFAKDIMDLLHWTCYIWNAKPVIVIAMFSYLSFVHTFLS